MHVSPQTTNAEPQWSRASSAFLQEYPWDDVILLHNEASAIRDAFQADVPSITRQEVVKKDWQFERVEDSEDSKLQASIIFRATLTSPETFSNGTLELQGLTEIEKSELGRLLVEKDSAYRIRLPLLYSLLVSPLVLLRTVSVRKQAAIYNGNVKPPIIAMMEKMVFAVVFGIARGTTSIKDGIDSLLNDLPWDCVATLPPKVVVLVHSRTSTRSNVINREQSVVSAVVTFPSVSPGEVEFVPAADEPVHNSVSELILGNQTPPSSPLQSVPEMLNTHPSTSPPSQASSPQISGNPSKSNTDSRNPDVETSSDFETAFRADITNPLAKLDSQPEANGIDKEQEAVGQRPTSSTKSWTFAQEANSSEEEMDIRSEANSIEEDMDIRSEANSIEEDMDIRSEANSSDEEMDNQSEADSIDGELAKLFLLIQRHSGPSAKKQRRETPPGGVHLRAADMSQVGNTPDTAIDDTVRRLPPRTSDRLKVSTAEKICPSGMEKGKVFYGRTASASEQVGTQKVLFIGPPPFRDASSKTSLVTSQCLKAPHSSLPRRSGINACRSARDEVFSVNKGSSAIVLTDCTYGRPVMFDKAGVRDSHRFAWMWILRCKGLRPEQEFTFSSEHIAWLQTLGNHFALPLILQAARDGVWWLSMAPYIITTLTRTALEHGSKLGADGNYGPLPAPKMNLSHLLVISMVSWRVSEMENYPNEDIWIIEAMVLGPNTRLIMAPNTVHAIWTMENSICYGGHFYSVSTLLHTVVGLIHAFIGDDVLTNTQHVPSRFLLRRMVHFFHHAFVVQGVSPSGPNRYEVGDDEHLPDLGDRDLFAATFALLSVIEMQNILDFRSYVYPNNEMSSVWYGVSEVSMTLCDVNAIPHEERLECILYTGPCHGTRKMDLQPLRSPIHSPPSDPTSQQHPDPWSDFYWPYLAHFLCAVKGYKKQYSKQTPTRGSTLHHVKVQIKRCVGGRPELEKAVGAIDLPSIRSIAPQFQILPRHAGGPVAISRQTVDQITSSGFRTGDKLYIEAYKEALAYQSRKRRSGQQPESGSPCITDAISVAPFTAFVNIYALIINGLVDDANEDEDEIPEEPQARREVRVYQKLLKMIPRSTNVSWMPIQKGANSARSDDTKTLKSAVVDWIVPSDGTPLNPPITRNVKMDRGFCHPRTGFLLCPAELDWADEEVKRQLRDKELVVSGANWPIFLYKDEVYDENEPWLGLFHSKILVKAYKHIFTSPSSVEREAKATCSGNARIHGMTSVTRASLAYIGTQVFLPQCLPNSETDSETFYNSVLDLLEDPEEQDEVQELLSWWNKRIFPSFSSSSKQALPTNSAFAKIKNRRARIKDAVQARGRLSTDFVKQHPRFYRL
ncbi:hypothetical protein BKA70DRAFT_1424106 [Coprinopsis sp. MPI-PUGE-AT-0042]|nr:hypothetical protein BKA70DRAFT_1424106 [Coprinopsis sp. MPI-PUGE-AT-0042]